MKKPTEEEIKKATEKLKNKYDIVVPKEAAEKYVKLIAELGFWIAIEKEFNAKETITENIVEYVKGYIKLKRGENISSEQAYLEANKTMMQAMPREKDRLANELRALIAKYK